MRRADNLTTFMCRLSRNFGASNSWNPKGPPRPVSGNRYFYLFAAKWQHIVTAVPRLRRLVAQFSYRRPWFNPRKVHVKFSVHTVTQTRPFLHEIQFSPVSIIPPLLHTNSFIYHTRCIMFLSKYFSFPLSVSFHDCYILIFILILFLSERKAGEAWEPPEKQLCFCSRQELDIRVFSQCVLAL
jgi:hypothetical protein